MADLDSTNVLRQFVEYSFNSDNVYQQGLASILGGGGLDGKSEQEKEEILRRSRVFYFNRLTGNSVTVEDTRLYEESLETTGPMNIPHRTSPPIENEPAVAATTIPGCNEPETRTLTFAELKELIETGKTDQIPNNKTIPDRLNEAPPSETTVSLRKKPWEIASPVE